MTVRLAVLGDPIAHSLSPRMQGAALSAAGIEGTYEAHHVTPDHLARHVQHLRDKGYTGFNVTIPHKRSILPLLDEVDADAAGVQAVNTAVRDGERLIGYNTDLTGFFEVLRMLNVAGRGLSAVIFGTGGSGRACAQVLSNLEDSLTLVSRDLQKSKSVASGLPNGSQALSYGDRQLQQVLERADIVVNATPLGMSHLADLSPIPEGVRLREGAAAIDLVYGRHTPFLRQAEAAGCNRADGVEMLVQQGAAAFRLWFGKDPDTASMRRACLEIPAGA